MSNDNDNTPDNVRPLFPKAIPQDQLPEPSEPKLRQDQYVITVWKELEDGSLTPYDYEHTGHVVITNTNVVVLDENGELKWACPNNDALISIARVDAPKQG